ncbi:hypothetical protein BGZ61DRAFT_450079 [Ilyonectria robusta]|uniref:uncharacterized protein n=1 Tax=Ilyonectria robusta TaxID=1079257 RepID=UPI001E8DBBCA|nr:uncharacterized protein BGZ61DRAFT_450079 [Ilyonectria robusta]KAH8706542.1 hypothetical protein BGZ61DRAFT_450079 [Ilyonectria robusta]
MRFSHVIALAGAATAYVVPVDTVTGVTTPAPYSNYTTATVYPVVPTSKSKPTQVFPCCLDMRANKKQHTPPTRPPPLAPPPPPPLPLGLPPSLAALFPRTHAAPWLL